MRKTILLISVAIIAVVGLPVLGIGQTTTSSGHGGSPSDVFTKTNAGTCLDKVSLNDKNVMQRTFTTGVETNVVAYFTGQFGSLERREEGRLYFTLYFPGGNTESPDQAIPGNLVPRTTATVMWSFVNVPAGSVQVGVQARVEQHPPGEKAPKSDLKNCALTVFVMPIAA